MEWMPFVVGALIVSVIINVICIDDLNNEKLSASKIDLKMWTVLLRIRVWLEYLDQKRGIVTAKNPLNFDRLPLDKHSFENIKGSVLEYFMKPLQGVALYTLEKDVIKRLEQQCFISHKTISEIAGIILTTMKELQAKHPTK